MGCWDKTLATALDRHQKLGARLLDLRDAILERVSPVVTTDEAIEARSLISKRELDVYSLSSSLCHLDVEKGEEAFREITEAGNKASPDCGIDTSAPVDPVNSQPGVHVEPSLRIRLPIWTSIIPGFTIFYRECIDRLFYRRVYRLHRK